MRVELHNQKGIQGEITLGTDGQAVGSNRLANALMGDTTIVKPGRPPTKLTPADGEEYLRMLPLNIAGSYFWAELKDA